MRRVFGLLLCLVVLGALSSSSRAEEYKLRDGTTIWGDVSDSDENGVVFRLDSGGFSQRISWSKFGDPTLELLAQDPEMREFAEPFIPVPPEARPKPKPVVIREYPKVDMPVGRTTIFSSLTGSLGLGLLGLLYAANLLAAYEIALYRHRPVAVVCGVSAIAPIVGPIAFLASPSLEPPGEEYDEAALVEEPGPAVPEAGSPAAATSHKVGTPAPMSSGLKVASAAKSSGGMAQKKVYNRNEVELNRRFIETQFSGFFRVVPTDAERDLVLVIKTPKQELIARRISRITATEMYVQLMQAGAKEMRVVLGEIAQIIVRHKDDKS